MSGPKLFSRNRAFQKAEETIRLINIADHKTNWLCFLILSNKRSVFPNHEILKRDIPKIIKFKATNSLRVSCLFCIFKHSPQKTV
ncbi:hypothetical protein GA409_09720 [Bacteroides xylanisolvens]|nr:hypothetical protein GA392_10005 [Bacteroides xylanisolvens]KAB6232134.1 hypothetical protein GA409_09720 [Bacteroides xylanisolvens]KAB6355422.1 hypothetical protein GA124_19290 [Bacteroides xylanisolvens]